MFVSKEDTVEICVYYIKVGKFKYDAYTPNDMALCTSCTTVTNNSTHEVTAPTLSSATIAAGGTTIVLVFDETIVVSSYEDGDFDLDCSVTGDDVALNSPSGATDTWTFSIAGTLYSGETCNIDFDSDRQASDIEDDAYTPNSMVLCTSCVTVINNSGVAAPTPTGGKSGSGIIFGS